MVWNSPFANTFSPRLRGRPADRGGGGGRGRLNSNVFQQRPPPPPSPSSSYGIAGGGIAAGVAGGGANRKWVNPLTLATASSVPPSDTAFTTLNPIPQQQLHQSASSSSFKTLSHGSTAVHQQRGGGARGGGRGAYSSSRRNSNNNINHHHHPPPTYQLPQQVQTQAINPTNFSKPASTVFISPLPPSNTPSQVINNNSNGPSNFIPSSIPSSSSFSSPDTSTAPLTLSHDPLLPPNHPYNSPDFIHRFNTDQALRKQALDIVHSTMSTTSSSDCAVMIVYQTDGSACLQQSKWSDLKDSM